MRRMEIGVAFTAIAMLGVIFSGSAFAENKIQNETELKLDKPLMVRKLCGVSEPYGLVFLQLKIDPTKPQKPLKISRGVHIYDISTGKMTLFSEFTKDIPQEDAMRIQNVTVSPCGNYVLCKKSDEEFYILDLKNRTAAKTVFTNGEEVNLTGWCGDVWYSVPINKKAMQFSEIQMRDVKGKKLDYPTIFGFPITATPNGSRLEIVAFQEDITKPFEIKNAKKAENFHLVSLDAKGNVIKKKTIKKSSPREKPEFF